MMRFYLAITVVLLFGSCDKDDSKDSATADADTDYSLATSDVDKAVSGGRLSGLEVTIKDGGETVDGELATTDVALSISCSNEDKSNKISIDKVVKAGDGVAKFDDIDLGGEMCLAGKYNCALSLTIKVDDELIKKKESFDIDIEKDDRCTETAPNEDQSIPAIGAGQLFEITANAGDNVELRKKADASGHCNALLLQEVLTDGELTGIKEQQIVIDSEGNASKLFIVGEVNNCELYADQTKIDKQFTSTAENDGSQIPPKGSENNITIDIGSDPNRAEDGPAVQALFISQGLTAVDTTESPSNPAWSKQWEKATAEFSWSRPVDSNIEWSGENNTAMAVIKVGDSWSPIGLIVPSATLQISGTPTAGHEFTVEGRDGGILSLADRDSSCEAVLYQYTPAVGDVLANIKKGNQIKMGSNGEADHLLIAGDPSNCQLLVGAEKVAGNLLAIPAKDGASVVGKTSTGAVSVILGDSPEPMSNVSELFIQLGTTDLWNEIGNGLRTASDGDKTFSWGGNRQETHVSWGEKTVARALLKTSTNKWYSIGY